MKHSANQIKGLARPWNLFENSNKLIEHMKREGFINPACYEFYGHRDKGNTLCPGDPLYALWGGWENWHRTC